MTDIMLNFLGSWVSEEMNDVQVDARWIRFNYVSDLALQSATQSRVLGRNFSAEKK